MSPEQGFVKYSYSSPSTKMSDTKLLGIVVVDLLPGRLLDVPLLRFSRLLQLGTRLGLIQEMSTVTTHTHHP